MPDARGQAAEREAVMAHMITEFHAALREMRCVGSQRLLRRGVSMSHLHVMSLLERHGEMTMTGLADVLDVSLSNATGLIDRMEERALVERVRVPDDRRIVRVRVTEAGRRTLADLEIVRDEIIARVLGRLDERQLARLQRAVGDLKAALVGLAAEEPELFAHDHQVHDPAATAAR